MAKKTKEDKEIAQEMAGIKRDAGHFYLYLLAAIFGLMAVSPLVNRYLEYYQGVVIAGPTDGDVEIMKHDSMIVTRSISDALAQTLSPGDYVEKTRARWDPVKISQAELHAIDLIEEPGSQPQIVLPRYYATWTEDWAGKVTKITRQKLPQIEKIGLMGGTKTERVIMTLQLVDGTEKVMEVPGELANDVKEGTEIAKRAGTWQAVITAQP